MKINKDELVAALEKVKPGLANKEIIEQSTSFAFLKNRVVTYNDEISISHPVTDLNLEGAVKAGALYSFLSRVKKDKISIQTEENQVIIKAGRAKAGLLFEQEVKLPVEEIGEIGDWKEIPENLLAAIKFCAPCASADMSRPVLTCLNMAEKSIQATDSFQIVEYKLKGKLPINSFLLPASTARILGRYKITHMAGGDNWVHFKTEDETVFSSRVLYGEFPDISAFMEFKGIDIVFPAKVSQILERAEVFSNCQLSTQDLKIVTIALLKNRMKFTSKDESGWFEEFIKIDYKGDPVKFTVGVEFLIELLSHTPQCIYSTDKIKFTGDNWVHVVAVNEIEED